MGLTTIIALAVLVLVGLPLAIVGLAAVGPIGWIVAAIVFPLVTLGTILWLGWVKRRPDDGPDTMSR